jgi:hypothetical protein
MSIAGINSNFSALSTADVQSELDQFSEDTQVLAESLQSQALENPALSGAASLLATIPTTLTSVLTESSPLVSADTSNETASSPSAQNSLFSTLADETVTAAPGQDSGFGIAAATSNNSQNSTQPGPLAQLLEEIQATAQQAYTASQPGSGLYSGGTFNTNGSLFG